MSSANKRWHFNDGESKVEFLYTPGEPDGFLTVARVGDGEDDDRVAILPPDAALALAQKLIDYARIESRVLRLAPSQPSAEEKR